MPRRCPRIIPHIPTQLEAGMRLLRILRQHSRPLREIRWTAGDKRESSRMVEITKIIVETLHPLAQSIASEIRLQQPVADFLCLHTRKPCPRPHPPQGEQSDRANSRPKIQMLQDRRRDLKRVLSSENIIDRMAVSASPLGNEPSRRTTRIVQQRLTSSRSTRTR